ncbi:hypothetical protein DLREEDagr8_08630 [Dongia sp. agr-C8]
MLKGKAGLASRQLAQPVRKAPGAGAGAAAAVAVGAAAAERELGESCRESMSGPSAKPRGRVGAQLSGEGLKDR